MKTGNELTQVEYGQNGGMIVTDTDAHTNADGWTTILVLSDTVFTTLTSNYTKNSETTLAVAADWGTLSAGTKLSGKFTAVTLASGSVLMLK